MPPTANWSYPTLIRFGVGRIAELGEACLELGIRRPLFVTDPVLAGLPMTHAALQAVHAAGLDAEPFSDVQPNPVGANVERGVEAFRQGGHDGVIGFGGGSALDAAKAIALMQGQTLPIWAFEDIGDWWTRADAATIAPVIAVPTTAGTGSEVGRASVITNEATHTKKIIFHPRMMPGIVIADPELTAGMPPTTTAGTGMDALAHCLEAYVAPTYHPMSEGIALEGLRLIKHALPRAFADGSDLEARADMMSAAAMGAVAFQKGLGAIHALSHPIGAVFGTHHGTTNAVVMQPVLRFNRPAIEDRLAMAAAYLGIDGGFDGFYAYVGELTALLGIPGNLTDLGVTDPDLDALVASALADPSTGGNPVEMTAENTRALFEACL